MPHTSHRRRRVPPASYKLTTTAPSTDGWTHVTSRAALASRPAAAPNTPTAHSSLLERLTVPQAAAYSSLLPAACAAGLAPRPATARHTVAELAAQHARVAGVWRASSARRALLALLSLRGGSAATDTRSDACAPRISRAVLLGLGSPSGDPSRWRTHSQYQLAAFLDLAALLSVSASASTAHAHAHAAPLLYAQDPVFNATDAAFLASLRVTVLASPAAFDEIDGATLVFAPHFPVAAWSGAMRRGEPAWLVGNAVEGAVERIPSSAELTAIFAAGAERAQVSGEGDLAIPDLHAKAELRDFQRRHDSCAFPLLEEEEHAFGDMRVYWPSEAGGDGGKEHGAVQLAVGDAVGMKDAELHDLQRDLQSLDVGFG